MVIKLAEVLALEVMNHMRADVMNEARADVIDSR